MTRSQPDAAAVVGPDAEIVGGRFHLRGPIGRGGSAVVFRARDELLGRDVALKVFDADHSGARDELRRETRMLAALAHPGVVPIYDVGRHDGRDYIVMTLVEGGSLAGRLAERGVLEARDVVRLGAQLCAALAHVHAAGVVHRDLKPANVLLDPGGRPFLSDFGTASVVTETATTRGAAVVGTPAYLAPEQVLGAPVGPPTDVYALGLVLLECVTGAREYVGPPIEAAVARLHRRPRIPAAVPRPVAEVLAALTADDPDERPDAATAGRALVRVAAELGLEATGTLARPAALDALARRAGSAAGATPRPGLSRGGRATAVVATLVLAVTGVLTALALTGIVPPPAATPGAAIAPDAAAAPPPARVPPPSPVSAPSRSRDGGTGRGDATADGGAGGDQSPTPGPGTGTGPGPGPGVPEQPDEPTPANPCPDGADVCIPRGERPGAPGV